jgi:hypothetical protein
VGRTAKPSTVPRQHVVRLRGSPVGRFSPDDVTTSFVSGVKQQLEASKMANSKYEMPHIRFGISRSRWLMSDNRFEYVKHFEQPDNLLPNTWIVVRIDGRGFTKFATKYGFEKPNDKRALDLMNAAARQVVSEISDITVAYGVSDEYRHVLAQRSRHGYLLTSGLALSSTRPAVSLSVAGGMLLMCFGCMPDCCR